MKFFKLPAAMNQSLLLVWKSGFFAAICVVRTACVTRRSL